MFAAARKDLKASGITVKEAEHAEMFSVEDASRVHPEFKPWPALIIPYVNPWTDKIIEYEKEGTHHQFIRVRYYPPKETKQSFIKKKPRRYSQPAKSDTHPYFPTVEGIDWVAVAKDTSIPIIVTEGEKKSICGCLSGIPTIGLGGVWNYRLDGELLPLLETINWHKRTTYICNDSDANTNSQIQLAEGQLAAELRKRRADVFITHIPEIQEDHKTGLDDFIVHEGRDKLLSLLESSPQLDLLGKAVLRMNSDVAWIEREGLMLDLKFDIFMNKSNFIKGSKYSSITVNCSKDMGKGKNIQYVADAWLIHPHARRYTDVVFRPSTESKTVRMLDGGLAYNRFRGIETTECVYEDVKPFFDLHDWMMSRTDEFNDPDLVWKTMAYKFRNWEENIGLGLMLLGPQGGGKSLFCKIVVAMARQYGTVISTDMLGGLYNGWLETSLVVIMNEAESRKMKDCMAKLRTYVTDKTQAVSEKYRVSRQAEISAFFIFNSNEHSAGVFTDDDRRMIVIGCPGTHPDGDAFYGPIYEWIKKGGPAKAMYWLQNCDLGTNEDGSPWTPPRHAPQTREKRMAYNISRTPVQQLSNNIKHASENFLALQIARTLGWARSGNVPNYQLKLAENIITMLPLLQIRPFYTPEELTLLFPELVKARYSKGVSPEGLIAQELIQSGIQYLRCVDNFDGFIHDDLLKQYLIIINTDEFDKPISQERFDELMEGYPLYEAYDATKLKKRTFIN